MIPALVVGCTTVGLGVIRSLGRRGIPVIALPHDAKDIAQRSRYVTARHVVPHPERQEAEFIARLKALGSLYPGAALIPTSDAAVAAISRQRSSLDDILQVGCMDWETAQVFIEKKRTYELAEAVGVAAPKTAVPTSEGDAIRYGEDAQYPVLIKPSQGHLYTARFGRKMTEVNSAKELVGSYREAREAGIEVMIQEIIPGPDTLGVNYNSFAIDGQTIVEFTARQLRNAPTGFGSPSAAVSEHIPDVLESGRAMIRGLGFTGFSCTEFKVDPRDGSIKLMEVNGRHNLSSLLAVECGVDFPWIHYDYLVNANEPRPSTDFRDGVYWIDLYRDVVTSLKSSRMEELTFRQYLRPYLAEHVYAVASLRDPMPFLAQTAKMALRLVPFRKSGMGA